MRLRNEAKVGLLIFIAIVILIAMYWFLRGLGIRTATFPVYAVFSDARKLDKGADVRMAGVKVGYVSDIGLTRDSRARVDMIVFNGTCVPHDSVARITTGGFIGDNYVDILPGMAKSCIRPHQKMASQEPMNYDQLISDVGGLIGQLKVSVAGINSVLGDKKTTDRIKDTVKQLELATVSANKLIQSAQGLIGEASPDIRRTMANLATATDNAAAATADMRDLIRSDAKPNAKAILAQAREAMGNLNATTSELRQLLSSLGQNTGAINQTFERINETANQAQQTMANLNAASGGIKDIATDQQLKADLKTTMANVACATEQAKELITCLNQKYGKCKTLTPVRKGAIPDYGLSSNSLWNTGDGNYRFDANYTWAGQNDSFYRIGAYNVGENTRLNLQMGKTLTEYDAIRYGLYASRIGVGYDHRFGNRFRVSGDLFRPNEPELELRGILNMRNGFSLYGGVMDLFHDQDVLVGVHYQK